MSRNNKPTKEDLANIYRHNLIYLKGRGKNVNIPSSVAIKYRNIELRKRFELLSTSKKLLPLLNNKKPHIEVLNMDSFECAKYVLEKTHSHPVVMNMASDKNPGGGAYNGSCAQEEELYRRSNYGICLPFERKVELYPIREDEVIWNNSVTVIRSINYECLPSTQFETFPCCAVAAIRNPSITPDGKRYKFDADKKLTEMKIENYFLSGLVNGYRNFVPGALGCGAFHNPSQTVAELYNIVIKKYEKYIETVTFAVLDFENNPYSNYPLFNRVVKTIV